MMRFVGLMAVIGFTLAGCGKDDDGDSGGTNTGDNTNACATVTPFPALNASDVYYRTTIEFDMGDAVESDATITVDAGGTPVTGTTTIIDSRVVFEPSAPLAPSTTHNVTLNWSCGPTTSSFTTSDIGGPVSPPDSLIGKTYALDLGAGRFVEPPGVGSLIGGLLTQSVLLGVTQADASIVHIMGALGAESGSGQDMCTESFDFPVDADFSENPYFVVASDALTLEIEGISIVIEDMEVSGAFADDGSQIAGASLAGTLDVSILADLVGSDPCALLVTFGVECKTCSDGVTQTCLSVFVDSMTADEQAGVTLVDRSAMDVACDASCGTVTVTGC